MKKIVSVILVSTVLIFLLYGCSNTVTEVSNDTTVSGNETTVTTTVRTTQPTTEPTIVTTTQQDVTTTKKEITTAATSKKVTTTKQQTTKKAMKTKPKTTTTTTTTQNVVSICTNNDNHSMICGGMGKWFNSRSEVQAYVSSVMESWNNKYTSGAITRDEYINNCPQGYKAWSCSYCGKWTGNFTY